MIVITGEHVLLAEFGEVGLDALGNLVESATVLRSDRVGSPFVGSLVAGMSTNQECPVTWWALR